MAHIQKVADTISEKSALVWFGIFPILIRPLTLAQIYDIGAVVERMGVIDIDGEFNPVVKMLQQYKEIKECTDIVKICCFRKRWKRKVFGRIITSNLTMMRYKQVIEVAALSFGAAFFLTSFTFLKGTKEVTKRTNTDEATASGDSLEE